MYTLRAHWNNQILVLWKDREDDPEIEDIDCILKGQDQLHITEQRGYSKQNITTRVIAKSNNKEDLISQALLMEL